MECWSVTGGPARGLRWGYGALEFEVVIQVLPLSNRESICDRRNVPFLQRSCAFHKHDSTPRLTKRGALGVKIWWTSWGKTATVLPSEDAACTVGGEWAADTGSVAVSPPVGKRQSNGRAAPLAYLLPRRPTVNPALR